MAIRYIYNCSNCNRDYIEQREPDLDQIVDTCECSGNFILSSQEELIEEVQDQLIQDETTEEQPVE